MITQEEFANNSICNFFVENRDSVPIIDVVKVDNFLYGNFDILIHRYYQGQMAYLPLLLDFNMISDPVEIKLGMIIEIPDIATLEQQLKINTIFDDDNVPGVNSSTNSDLINIQNTPKNSKTSKVTALPKLKITKRAVSYDVTTGQLKF